MTSRIIADVELEAVLTWLVGRWGGDPGATLRLFRNDLEPTPSTTLSAFLEANFLGYAPVLLAGDLTAPAKAETGVWESLSDLHTWFPPASGSGNMIFGAYVVFGGQAVASGRFGAAIPMEVGGVPLSVRLCVTTKSESFFLVS